jgi:simple sugar transport system ATP-binding protein
LLNLRNITKRFGGNVAVNDVSLELRGGEILAIVGENGAGKTTLMRIAAGELAADAGVITNDENIGFVHQHFLLVNDFTIAENLALQRAWRFASLRKLEEEAEAIIASTGIDLHGPSRRVEELSVGERSKLELIKAIAKKPQVLILDEPTSVLTPAESQELFAVMRRLARDGAAVVFISHKIPEVLEIADRIVVMRAGRVVLETKSMTAEELALAMIDTAVLVSSKTSANITAIVGVAGNGQSQMAETFRDERPDAGLIPEDRTRDGIIAEMSIAENLALRTKEDAAALIRLYSIKATGPQQTAGSLSGGNQQKVILARELSRKPRMILAAEPTRGLDIEATAFVHEQLRTAADSGATILLITSDLDEAFALAGSIRVIYRGELSEAMPPEVARERVGALMAGLA